MNSGALHSYIEATFDIAMALIMTSAVLLLTVALGGIIYALYKGATDERWR